MNKNYDLGIAVMAIFSLVFILFGGCSSEKSETEKAIQKTEQQYAEFCRSKSSGSAPRCWSQRDWEVFCSKVQCK